MKNYYHILGVPEDATIDEIIKAYRKLSLKFHPDNNDNDSYFNEMFKNITEAYDVLVDPVQKSKYDKQLLPGIVDSIEFDNLIVKAGLLVVENNMPSASMLMRKLNIGYNHGIRLMYQLEALGIVSPAFENTARKVLVSKSELEGIFSDKVPGLSREMIQRQDMVTRSHKKTQKQPTKSNIQRSVWDGVKTWKKIMWAIFIIDILLLVILIATNSIGKT